MICVLNPVFRVWSQSRAIHAVSAHKLSVGCTNTTGKTQGRHDLRVQAQLARQRLLIETLKL